MKTLLQLTAIATLIVAISFNLNASNINIVPDDETYINDIPFSTEEVAANYLYEKALSETFEFFCFDHRYNAFVSCGVI